MHRQNTISSFNSWVLASRPKTLTAALVPVCVGTALAQAFGYSVAYSLSFFALLSAFSIQIGTNLVNDALDFKKGADTQKRLGPTRVTQQGLLSMRSVLIFGVAFFVMAIVFGIPLIIKGGAPLAIVLAISVLMGYCYTGGPFPLAYVGLGDLFVILFFGLVSTASVYYLQSGHFDTSSLIAGLQIGLLATVMIAINNLRDNEGDAQAGKYTLAVRFGTAFARAEIISLMLLPYVIGLIWLQFGLFYAAVLPLMTLPLALRLSKRIYYAEIGPVFNVFLGLAALLHLSFGLLLTIGLWLESL